MVFGQNRKNLSLVKRISYKRALQEEQNGANFSFVTPSSEEIMAVNCMRTVKVVTPTSAVACANIYLTVQQNRIKS